MAIGETEGRGLTHSASSLSVGTKIMAEATGGASLAFYTKSVDQYLSDYLSECVKASYVIEKLKKLMSPAFSDVFIVRSIQMVIPMPEQKQTEIAQLLTIAFDAHLFTKTQATRAFEKLLQQAVGFRQLVAEPSSGAIEAVLFAFFNAACDDGWVNRSFLARLPEHFVKNLPADVLALDPMLKYNSEQLRRYKAESTKVIETFIVEGSTDSITEFMGSFACEPLSEPLQALVNEKGAEAYVPQITPALMAHELVRRALVAGITSTSPTQKELISRMLSDLYATYFFSDDIQLGVIRLLAGLEDLILDCPNAPETLSKYIVRMYVDDILCPSFVNDFLRISLGDQLGVATLRRSFKWITSGRHVLAEKFSKVWIATEPYRPEVEQFRKDLEAIVFDFLETGDVATAVSNFQMLEMSPDQEVQALRKAIIYTMERRQEEWSCITTLIEALIETRDIEPESVAKALQEIQDRIADIRLDNPLVDQALEGFFIPQLALIVKAHVL